MSGDRGGWTLWLIPLAILAVAGAAFVVYWTTTKATVRVITTPPGVTVRLSGDLAGVTADSGLVVRVQPGPLTIDLAREGYEPVTVEVALRRGEVYDLVQVLRPPGMVYVSGGAFEMGTDDGAFSERPAHTVALNPYYIDRTEVTAAAFGARNPGYRPSFRGEGMPATNVSWAEADAFCRATGKRLPTEAEWERACRGPNGSAYAYGDAFDTDLGRSGLDLAAGPVAVGNYPPGNAGTHDLTGNVWEWTADWYGRDYYRTSPDVDPKGPAEGERRVLRGGAWFSNASFSKCTHRPGNIRSHRDPSFGFRCVRDLD